MTCRSSDCPSKYRGLGTGRPSRNHIADITVKNVNVSNVQSHSIILLSASLRVSTRLTLGVSSGGLIYFCREVNARYRENVCLAYPVVAYTGEIVGGIVGGLAFIIAAVVLILYRNWKYEQELDSLLWKVNFKDIQIKEQKKDEVAGANEAPAKCNSKVTARPEYVAARIPVEILFSCPAFPRRACLHHLSPSNWSYGEPKSFALARHLARLLLPRR